MEILIDNLNDNLKWSFVLTICWEDNIKSFRYIYVKVVITETGQNFGDNPTNFFNLG